MRGATGNFPAREKHAGVAANSRESRSSLGGLVIAFVMLLTVLTVVALGVATTYGLVTGILFAFAHQSRQRERAAVLVPSESHASGD
jgi:hypothetical protein